MRRILILSIAAVFVGLASLTIRAQSGPNPEGQPTSMREGALASYWIWHDGEGYHVRTTTAHDRRIFAGHIDFAGGNGWAKGYQLRQNDEVKLTNQGITFHLATERDLSGFDFRMDYGTQATFSLQLDDDKGDRILGHVFVGQNNAHPITNPFTINAVSSPGASYAPPPMAPVPNPSPVVAGQSPASVDFSSDPLGADILIDGYFKGNTPSTLQVTPGQHTVELRLRGYRSYATSVSVDAGSHPRISQSLQPQ